jgi:mono/diheme cytochrome c family protein
MWSKLGYGRGLLQIKGVAARSATFGKPPGDSPMTKSQVLAAALLMALPATGAAAAQTARAKAGERLARTYCAECHAVAKGKSPLADAPPFRELHKRYPKGGGLNDLLAKGMVLSVGPEEEGSAPRHPRMPQVRLDEAQIGDLTAYLESIQPKGR